jgi:hypothetical protein
MIIQKYSESSRKCHSFGQCGDYSDKFTLSKISHINGHIVYEAVRHCKYHHDEYVETFKLRSWYKFIA